MISTMKFKSLMEVCCCFFSILTLGGDGLFLVLAAVLTPPSVTTTGSASRRHDGSVAYSLRMQAAFLPSASVLSKRHTPITSRRRYRCFSGLHQGLQMHLDALLTDGNILFIDTSCSSSVVIAAAGVNQLDFGSISSNINWWFVWPLRLASALVSYIALIAFFDRPRGALNVSLNNVEIQIKPSTVPNAGLGLFAKVPLRKGTMLGTYPGVLVPLSQNLPKLRAHPECEGYIWRFSDNRYVIDPTNDKGEIQDACRFGGNPSLPGSIWICRYIIPLFKGGIGSVGVDTALCRINEPPRGRDVNVVTNEDLNSRTVTFTLERDVWPDEEFYIDYGISYDRSRYGGGGAGGVVAATSNISEERREEEETE
jgi:hypothetical protein